MLRLAWNFGNSKQYPSLPKISRNKEGGSSVHLAETIEEHMQSLSVVVTQEDFAFQRTTYCHAGAATYPLGQIKFDALYKGK